MSVFFRQTGHILAQTAKAWNAHDAPQMGAALAYYTLFSMAPILIIAIAVAGLLFGVDAARDGVSHQMEGMLGVTGAAAVQEIIANAGRRGSSIGATVIGTATLLFGATSLFGELRSALNTIWGAPPAGRKFLNGFLHARFLSFAMVLVIGFLLLVSLLVSAALSGLAAWFDFASSQVLAQVVDIVLSLAVTTVLFALIYKVLPDVDIAWRDVGVGAVVTAVLFAIGKLLIGLYIGNSALASGYGAAGSFVVLLVWVYYSAQILLFGAEFTHVYAHWHGSKVGQPLAVLPPAAAAP